MGLIKSIRRIMSKPDGDVSEASLLSGVSSNNLTFIEACARTAKLTAQSVLAKMSSEVSPVGVHRYTTVTCSLGQYSAPPHVPLPLPNGINVNNINNYNISYRFWMYVNPDDNSKTELTPFNGTSGNCYVISINTYDHIVYFVPNGFSISTGQLVWVEATVTKK